MAMITIKCPACGEMFQADDSREFGFCSYCGAKVEMADAIIMTEGAEMNKETASLQTEAVNKTVSEEYSVSNTEEAPAAKKYISKLEFNRKKAFERRCNEQIAFFADQLGKPDKKRVNSRAFFNEHMTEWQEALYTVQKELKDAEIKED